MIGGGKFGNGAMTGAFGYLFNCLGGHACPSDMGSPESNKQGLENTAGDALMGSALKSYPVIALVGCMAGTICTGLDWVLAGVDLVPGGKSAGFVLGAFKSEAKWIAQMTQRGWTTELITEAIQYGKQFPAANLVNKGNDAVRYVHPATGQSVVMDSVTREVIHVGGKGFKY